MQHWSQERDNSSKGTGKGFPFHETTVSSLHIFKNSWAVPILGTVQTLKLSKQCPLDLMFPNVYTWVGHGKTFLTTKLPIIAVLQGPRLMTNMYTSNSSTLG